MIPTYVTIGGRDEPIELDLPEAATRARLLEQLSEHFEGDDTPLVFLDDADQPLDKEKLPESEPGYGRVYHCSTCRKMLVIARYGGDTVTFNISPAAYIARVLKRALEELAIQPNDCEHLFLQFAATGKKPPVTAPLGTVATGPDCDVVFDVVSEPITNG